MTAALNVAVIIAVITLVVGYAVLKELPRRRWEDPLRKEMRAQPLTFQAAVDLKIGAVDPMQSERGPVNLRVHVDTFEVASAIPIYRFVNGADFCYRAQDTTVEMVHAVLHDWIEICGQPGTGAVRIRIGRRKMTRRLWDALVSAGAHPTGPPPPL
jgi:hypothetical protein